MTEPRISNDDVAPVILSVAAAAVSALASTA